MPSLFELTKNTILVISYITTRPFNFSLEVSMDIPHETVGAKKAADYHAKAMMYHAKLMVYALINEVLEMVQYIGTRLLRLFFRSVCVFVLAYIISFFLFPFFGNGFSVISPIGGGLCGLCAFWCYAGPDMVT